MCLCSPFSSGFFICSSVAPQSHWAVSNPSLLGRSGGEELQLPFVGARLSPSGIPVLGKQMKGPGMCSTSMCLRPHLPFPTCWRGTVSMGFGNKSQCTSDMSGCPVYWKLRNALFFSLLCSFFFLSSFFFFSKSWVGNPTMFASNSEPDRSARVWFLQDIGCHFWSVHISSAKPCYIWPDRSGRAPGEETLLLQKSELVNNCTPCSSYISPEQYWEHSWDVKQKSWVAAERLLFSCLWAILHVLS